MSAVRAAIVLACAVASVVRAAEPVSPPARPNIVLIMADDMGYSDLGCYGSEIATPNLDKLAAGGVRFTQFYNCARCCPTRAALLTGLYPHQAGVGHMVAQESPASYQGYLNDRCVTIAEALKSGGYRTLMAGKWHVGENRPHWPCDRGFDEYFGLISGASNYFRLDATRKMALNNDPFVPSGGKHYMTDAFTDHAVRFLETYGREPEPFFLYVAYTAPHWPLHAWPDDIAKYRGKYRQGWDALRQERHKRMIEMGIVDAKWELTPRDETARPWEAVKEKDDRDLRMAVYAAQIDRLDQNIGRLLAKLHELGIEDHTLVMFLADNGGCAEAVDRGKPGAAVGTADSFSSYGLPWANASNTPFRLYKHWVHEGGISTPFIARWPSVIKQPGVLTREVGHVIDVMATCVDVAAVAYPRERDGQSLTRPEGLSLAPIFREGRRQGHDVLCWEHEGNRAARQGKWKLVAKAGEAWELYDLDADRTELHDLAPAHPDVVQRMTGLYDKWAARVGVRLADAQATKKPRGKTPGAAPSQTGEK